MSRRFFSEKIQKHDSKANSQDDIANSFGISMKSVPLQMKSSRDDENVSNIGIDLNKKGNFPWIPGGNIPPGVLDDILPIPNLIPDGPGKGGVLFDDDKLPILHSDELSGDSDLELCLLGGKFFKKGSRGNSVTKIQKCLIKLLSPAPKNTNGVVDIVHDSALPKYGADGIFLHETHAAVVRFQLNHGLSPDGIVGKNTLKKMDTLLAPQSNNGQNDPNKSLTKVLEDLLRKNLGKKDDPNPGNDKIDPKDNDLYY